MKLSVVIPAYNEEKDIEKAVADVVEAFPDAEIVVINDASTDKTLDILTRLQKTNTNLRVYTNKKNKGHGFSVIYGLWKATGHSILYIDADRQIDLSNFYRIPQENLFLFDIISGQRVHRNDKLFRKITSIGLRLTILLRHRMYIKDSNCPFKIYKREAIRPLLQKLPSTLVIPVACLEVLARKEGLLAVKLDTPHHAYDGVRDGFLQLPNARFFRFVWRAFNEIVRL